MESFTRCMESSNHELFAAAKRSGAETQTAEFAFGERAGVVGGVDGGRRGVGDVRAIRGVGGP